MVSSSQKLPVHGERSAKIATTANRHRAAWRPSCRSLCCWVAMPASARFLCGGRILRRLCGGRSATCLTVVVKERLGQPQNLLAQGVVWLSARILLCVAALRRFAPWSHRLGRKRERERTPKTVQPAPPPARKTRLPSRPSNASRKCARRRVSGSVRGIDRRGHAA